MNRTFEDGFYIIHGYPMEPGDMHAIKFSVMIDGVENNAVVITLQSLESIDELIKRLNDIKKEMIEHDKSLPNRH